MNEIKDALAVIDGYINHCKTLARGNRACNLSIWCTMETAKKALEKQIPKKLLPPIYGLERCPCCETEFNSDEHFDFCMDCGQALDWSD